MAKPFYKLTEKQAKFQWGSECDRAFSNLKNTLVDAATLAYPNPCSTFISDADANGVGIGAVLSQKKGNVEHVIGYYSRSLTRTERGYWVTKRALLAVADSIKHFHVYLYGNPFIIHSVQVPSGGF